MRRASLAIGWPERTGRDRLHAMIANALKNGEEVWFRLTCKPDARRASYLIRGDGLMVLAGIPQARDELRDEVEDLRREVARLQDEVHGLRESGVVRRAPRSRGAA